ncbi:MAG TPA: DNA helicase RecQ [Acidobacteriota bacterium]|nr:DNA helicase RecQ [Acidobacteriota bacterium]
MTEPAPVNAASLLPLIRKYWGHDTLRPLQAEAMACVLAGRDSVVVLPTGGGKSLCFQAPAVAMPGLSIVVTPLLSLMKDQTDALRACGIAAGCLSSMQSSQERSAVERQLTEQKLKLLYVAPERLASPRFTDLLRSLKPSFFAIDEAHCISSWGHEFRPDYRKLTVLRQMFPEVGIHAFTATATPRVRTDITDHLALRSPAVHVGSFDRPNLTYRVERKSRKWEQICSVIERHKGESGIIYCISRRNVDDLCSSLREVGYRALPYHAGLDDADRKRHQEAFTREDVDIIVATVAFGMGIDKSNVRYVLHAAAPKSIENYQQEAGRAGRDGLPAECVLLWGPGDFVLWRRILGGLDPQPQKAALRKLSQLSKFCEADVCRHRALVAYFGQAYDSPNCRACDRCLGEAEPVADPLTVAQKILSCVVRLGEPQTADYIGHVLTGSDDERIPRQGHDQLSTFGVLRECARQDICNWIEQLRQQEFLVSSPESDGLTVTAQGWEVLRGQTTPFIVNPRRATGRRVTKAQPLVTKENQELFDELRALRRRLADEGNVPAFVVFSDAVLVTMAQRRPGSLRTFLQIGGVGEKKCGEYGPTFVRAIVAWCQERNLATDVTAAVTEPPKAAALPPEPLTNAAELAAHAMFSRGMPIVDVGNKLHRARSTLVRYLVSYLERSGQVSPEPWLDSETFSLIRDAANRVGLDRLRPIFDDLEGKADYDAIRIGLTCLNNAGVKTGVPSQRSVR